MALRVALLKRTVLPNGRTNLVRRKTRRARVDALHLLEEGLQTKTPASEIEWSKCVFPGAHGFPCAIEPNDDNGEFLLPVLPVLD